MISGRHNYGVSLMAQWKRTRQQCRGPRRCGFDSLGWEDALEEEMATHSSIRAWRIPWTGGAWRAMVHGVTQSCTWLKRLSFHTQCAECFQIAAITGARIFCVSWACETCTCAVCQLCCSKDDEPYDQSNQQSSNKMARKEKLYHTHSWRILNNYSNLLPSILTQY